MQSENTAMKKPRVVSAKEWQAARDKMLKNAAKYPAEKSRGRYDPPPRSG